MFVTFPQNLACVEKLFFTEVSSKMICLFFQLVHKVIKRIALVSKMSYAKFNKMHRPQLFLSKLLKSFLQ